MKILTTVLIAFTFFLACKKSSLYNTSDLAVTTNISENTDTFLTSEKTGNDIVFIAGFDEDDNAYYANATTHFKKKNFTVVEGLFSIEEIINYLNKNNKNYSQIHIVSHSNAWRGMALMAINNGDRITTEILKNKLLKNNLPKLQQNLVPENLIFHSCGLGEHPELMIQLQQSFSNAKQPKIYASKYFNVFGGKFVPHYLAEPYYVFYPTANSPGPKDLSLEIAKTYPRESLNWFENLKTREESSLGSPYSYRFNIPVTWEVTFENESDVPNLKNKDSIMDFILEQDDFAMAIYNLEIPIEKFRWKTTRKGKTLKIEGKSTALCVLKPIMQKEKKFAYAATRVSNPKLYVQL